jgi:dienelactone hydrolase
MRGSGGRLAAVLAAVALVATACWTPSFTDGAYTVTVTSNVVYGQGEVDGGGTFVDLHLDLYTPQGTGRDELPLVVVMHGGGFTGGSKSASNIVVWATEFAERGYIVASIQYRLQGSDPVPSARMQPMLPSTGGDPQAGAAVAAMDDLLTALDHLIAMPETSDTSTALVGGSAGSVAIDYVAYALDDFGIARPPIRAVVSNWGGFPVGSAADFIQNPAPTVEDPYFEPPIFLAHATGDFSASPYSLSVDIADRAAEVGLPHVFHTKVGDVHAFDLAAEEFAPGTSVLEAQIAFVTCTLHPHLADTPECSTVSAGPT